ncbi:MAG: protein-tyrosine-phosphatase [Ignavibacteriae bacterium]|nr:protein-tyrosine-phosphatase [Ignavibacteriota bacterium]
MFSKIENYLNSLTQEFYQISDQRKDLLNDFVNYILQKQNYKENSNLIFICTHNSRRSQFAQIWAKVASDFYGIENINCFSGGTEVTAFNPRAIKTLKQIGFEIINSDKTENPAYLIKYSENSETIKCFSKIYSDSNNPQNNFAAIMTCSDADENCPVVFGAEKRFPIRYEDPKKFDDTELEESKYLERCSEIAREMLFVFQNLSQKI